jgi:hypothetical protein
MNINPRRRAAAREPEVTRPVAAHRHPYLKHAALLSFNPCRWQLPASAALSPCQAEHHAIDQRQGIVSVYHLIERGSVSEYQQALSHIQSPSMTVTCPWPPFAFAPDLWP